jgi:UDP-N-acetylglucosamine 1-carboxyvinyltransferase
VHYRIQGPARLAGRFRPSGNKNGALPILAACMLTDEPVVLENVPEIRDVFTMIELIQQLGATVEHVSDNTFRIDAADVNTGSVDPDLSRRIRASILLAGPLLARLGEVVLPPPGGDVIGRRRLDTHFLALSRLGSKVEAGESYELRAKELRGADLFLDEPSVTGTENAILAAVRATGETTIRNSAAEPHVQDLCNFLVSLGAEIEGIGTHRLTIRGVPSLSGGTWRVGTDHIEVGSMIGLAAITGSELAIEQIEAEHFDPLRVGFEKLGIHCKLRDGELLVSSDQALEVQPDLGDQIPTLGDGPWPAFPADLMSIALVVATQCRGTILIHEKLFESRMYFADKVIAMGARVVLCDPHRAVVVGPSDLRGSVMESPDIRAGMALLIAALAADGESLIHNIGQIERGYERIDVRLRALGAEIEKVEPSC